MERALLEEILQNTDSVLPIPLAKSAFSQALVFDLNNESATVIDVNQVYLNKYVGGPALCARLWADYVDRDPIVITGSNNGSLVTVCFKSPVTQEITFNAFSGRLTINYCAVIIVGSLKKKGIAVFEKNFFRVDHKAFLYADYPGSIFTGLAAENEIKYACAICNSCITGRGGLGYVMAQKNLKAIELGILPTVRDTYDFSTFVRDANIVGWAAIDNISKRTDPRLFHLCTSEKNRILGDVFIPCQAILMLGSNVGCYDISQVYERYMFCLENGIDPVSVGNVLGWIMEAQERGLIAFSKPVDFTNSNQVMSLLEAIANRDNGYEVFGEGTQAVAEFYGNVKYAKAINGLECGPYDYRGSFASALNDALGNWFPVYFDLIADIRIRNKVALAIYNEEMVMGLQCLNINPDVVVPMMAKKLGKLKKFLIKNNLVRFENAINTNELDSTDAFTLGQNCRAIVRGVNHCLHNGKKSIPDYFCIDPESNAQDRKIVNIKELLSSYKKALQSDK